MDELSTGATGGRQQRITGWRANLTSAGSNRSQESQDITYVPNSMLKSRASTNSLATLQQGNGGRQVRDDSSGFETCGDDFLRSARVIFSIRTNQRTLCPLDERANMIERKAIDLVSKIEHRVNSSLFVLH